MNVTEVRNRVLDITGYRVSGDAYLIQAFTRSSVPGCENNEIFEMYGDEVLGYYVMQIIHERYGFFRTEGNVNYKGENGYALTGIRSEKTLDKIRKTLVSNETLAAQVDVWGLNKYLQMGPSDQNNHVNEQTKVKADLFEAILGMIAVSCNFNPDILKKAVEKMLPFNEVLSDIDEEIWKPSSFTIDNAVTILKELSEKQIISEPQYIFKGPQDGLGTYFGSKEPCWTCHCVIMNNLFNEVVFSNSKKTAKNVAAYKALCKYYEKVDEISVCDTNWKKYIVKKNGSYVIKEIS